MAVVCAHPLALEIITLFVEPMDCPFRLRVPDNCVPEVLPTAQSLVTLADVTDIAPSVYTPPETGVLLKLIPYVTVEPLFTKTATSLAPGMVLFDQLELPVPTHAEAVVVAIHVRSTALACGKATPIATATHTATAGATRAASPSTSSCPTSIVRDRYFPDSSPRRPGGASAMGGIVTRDR